MLDIPVVGAGRSMYALASVLGHKFGIVTMWKQWFPLYERVLTDMGLTSRCAGIRSIEVTPDNRTLLAGKDHALPLLVEAAESLVNDADADVICLGSTTMHEAHAHLQEHLSVPVINPGPLSYFIADSMVALGLSHSRSTYPRPQVPKPDVLEAMLDAAALAESGTEASE
jgi:allantoin racemase